MAANKDTGRRIERGAALREKRRSLGLAREIVALAAAVHFNSVRNAERGVASETTLERIELALGIRQEQRA
jgi:hypothetical protein